MADLASVLWSLEPSLDDSDAPTWPASMEAAAFAATMKGAMLQLRQGASFGEGGYAVATGEAGMGGELAAWPATTGRCEESNEVSSLGSGHVAMCGSASV
jgi:hypothetical protein